MRLISTIEGKARNRAFEPETLFRQRKTLENLGFLQVLEGVLILVGEAGLEPASLAASDPKSDVSANFTTRPVSWMWGRFYAIGPIEVKDNAQRTLRGRFADASRVRFRLPGCRGMWQDTRP